MIKIDDEVMYWTRRVGERAVLHRGKVLELSPSGTIARVHLWNPPGALIEVVSVETKRLIPR